jgi:exosortase H (IPTLxxWG-CTERM-specific)
MRRFAVLFLVLLAALFAFELSPPGQAIVRPWTALVASASSQLIALLDGDAVARGNVLYSARSGFAVGIEAGCNGVEAMLVLLAGILAFPASARWKLAGLAIGFLAIQGLNIVRIASLFYLGQWSERWFEFAHLYLWQTLIMLDALLVWLLWMRAAPPRAPLAPAAA